MQTQNTNKNIVVIADDLTGANDTGVQFAKQGLKTIVLIGINPVPSKIEDTVVVVDSESRALKPDDAYRKVFDLAMLFRESCFQTVFKKIDSTLRGNIGREIDAIMDIYGQELAIVAPAFPKNGRISVGGYLLLHSEPLEATEIARDPKCPITESHIQILLSRQTNRKIGHVGIKNIIDGPVSVMEAMAQMVSANIQVIICDVWQDKHLKMLATAAIRLNKSVLWVGSAGLAEYLPSVLGFPRVLIDQNPRVRSSINEEPVVVIAGSVSNVTRTQVRMLKEHLGITHLEINPSELLRQDTASREIQQCLNATMNAIRNGYDVVITSGYSDEIVNTCHQEAASMNLAKAQMAEEIAAAMGRLCRKIVSNVKLSGLVLTGGDIALYSCKHLSASGFKVVEEVAPGIPLGILKGGQYDGLKVITKAGAFGSEDALCKAVDYLKHHTI